MKPHRSLLLTCLLALSFFQLAAATNFAQRDLISLPGNSGAGTGTGTGTETGPATGTGTGTSTGTGTGTGTDSAPANTGSGTSPASTNTATNTATSTGTDANTASGSPTPTPTPTQTPTIIGSLSTNSNGQVTVMVTNTSTLPDTATSASSSPSPLSSDTPPSNSGLGTGSIIGLSVAGGVAVLGIIGFFIWKFTRKRFTDFDDNEAIKWPELNAHSDSGGDSHALPVHSTGRVGFDTGSEVSLSRAPSNSTNTYSTPDLASNDPYSVPPLPHLNPNQPYRDDPSGSYYDPYRGPVPQSFHDPPGSTPEWAGQGGEAIAMTQMSSAAGASTAGRRSPGPGPAYDVPRTQSPGPANAYAAGRASPGPNMAYGGRASPGPNVAYGGRASPGPHNAYGMGQ